MRYPAYKGVGNDAIEPFVTDILRIIYGNPNVPQTSSDISGIIDINLEST